MRLSGTKTSSVNQYNGLGDQLYDLGGAKPTLDLNFSSNESLVDSVTGKTLVDHTRQSSATYVDGDGVIRTAVTNLLLQSENFSTTWLTAGTPPRVGITVNQTAAPDGANTADLAVPNTASSDHVLYQNNLISTSSAVYTFTLYAKASGYSYLQLLFTSPFNNNDAWANFALTGAGSLGFVGSGATASIQELSNGWYRCRVTATSGSGVSNAGVAIIPLDSDRNSRNPTFTGDGTSGLYIWGAQLEESSTVGQYVKTTTAINSAPRFDHDPETGESLGLLVEESRTNLLDYSEDVSQSFNSTGVNIDLEQGTAPDGTNTANKLSGVNNSTDLLGKSGFSANTYTFSFWIKAVDGNTGTWGINWYAGSHNRSTVPVTDSWVRHSVTFTSTTSTNIYIADNRDGLADLTEALVWGVQVEAGSFPTSYIPTEGSTVTRAADVTSITGTNFSSWYEQSEGTVFSNATAANAAAIAGFDDGTTNERWRIGYAPSNNAAIVVVDNGIVQTNFNSSNNSTPFNQFHKIAGAIATNNLSVAFNSTLYSDNTLSVPTINRLNLGRSIGISSYLNGTINRLTYWPTRLSNDTLQTITT